MHDRLPENGIEGFVAGVAMEMSPDMLAALMKPLTGILEVLK